MIWILFAAGCTGSGAGAVGEGEAFSLALDVQTALNQTGLIDEVSRFDLIVEYPSGRETFPLSSAEPGGEAEVVVDALRATSIALAGYDGQEELIAFGRSAALTIADGSLSATLTLFRVDDFAWLDLPDGDEMALSAAVSTADGNFWISGGIEGGNIFGGSTKVVDTWWKLSLVGGSPEITKQDLLLPSLVDEERNEGSSLNITGRAGHSMTHLGDGRLLIAGGASGFTNGEITSLEAYSWDTRSDGIVSSTPVTGARAFHRSATTSSGNVVLVGGFGLTGYPDQFTINEDLSFFDVGEGEFTERLYTLTSGPTGAAVASLGEDGVLVCGGIKSGAGNDLKIVNGCDRVGIEGGISADTAMQSSLVYGELIPLTDGRAMLIGGVEFPANSSVNIDDQGFLYATSHVWIYEDGRWTAVRPMKNARALHAAVPLPDGRVLVAGGFREFVGLVYFWQAVPLACAEIYDPSTDIWEEVGGSCDGSTASSALPTPAGAPSFAWDDDYGVLLFGGVDEVGRGVPYASLFVGAPDL